MTVTRSATITVRNVLYTVPSRLIGCRVKVHIYDDRLVCYLGTTPVLTVARRYFKRNGPRQRVVDYRHLIGGLIRKPQAFRHSVFRDELFPSPIFRRAWEALDHDSIRARLAGSMSGCCISPPCRAARRRSPFISRPCSTPAARPISKPRDRRGPPIITAPAVIVMAPDLAAYDELLRMPSWEMPRDAMSMPPSCR